MIGLMYKYINPYNNSLIYELYDISNPEHRYIGSTKDKLKTRLTDHKTRSKQFLSGQLNKYCTSHEIIKNNNYDIRIIQKVNVESKSKLYDLEGFYQRTMNCVNRIIQGRTPKQRYIDNKDKILKIRKQYYKDNKNKILKIRKQYYKDNKDKILLQRKQYYQNKKLSK